MARPSRLFLHIGLPKTGTSAWQDWAVTHRAALLARGLDYPEPDLTGEAPGSIVTNHRAIQPGIMKRDPSRLRRFLDEGRCATMLLSAEGLSNNLTEFPREGLRLFREVTAGIEVVCILTLRGREDWLRSLYRQSVLNPTNARMGNGMAETIAQFAERPRIQMMMDHERLVSEAVQAFGAVRCETIPYGADAFARFCAVLGLHAEDFPPPRQVNVSAPVAVEEVMLQVNASGAGDAVRDGILWLINKLNPIGHDRLLAAQRPDGGTWGPMRTVLDGLQPAGTEAADLAERLRAAARDEDAT